MTFPTVAGTTDYTTSATTSWAVFSGVAVNKGSVVVVSAEDAGTLSTASTDWTKLGQVDGNGGSSAIFVAGANMPSSSLVVATTASSRMAAVLVKAVGGGVVSATGQASTKNPPSHAIDSARDVLWVASVMTNNGTGGTYTAPSGYGAVTKAESGNAFSGCGAAIAYRSNAAASEDPAAWSSPDPVAAWTIALYAARRAPTQIGIL